jgi:hypothetical protein
MESGMDAEEMSRFTTAKNDIHQRLFRLESILLDQLLSEAADKGDISPMDAEEQRRVVFALVCALHGLKREFGGAIDARQAEPIIRSLTRALVHGLRG